MELALKKETVAYCGCVFEKSVKQNLDLGWNLPDYCGEIRRILHCAVTLCVGGVSVCADASPDEGGDSGHISALTLYFARPGETLWDIAKRYRTSVEAIQKENALDSETVSEERMLLVPR